MSLTREQLEQKFKENSITAQDFDKTLQDHSDVEKYGQLKEKMKNIEDEHYLLDRLEACGTLGATEVLREFWIQNKR